MRTPPGVSSVKKIPSEMAAALRYTLIAVLTLCTVRYTGDTVDMVYVVGLN